MANSAMRNLEFSLMHKIHLACAALGTAASLFAQCAGGPPAATLSTRSDFVGSFYYGSTTAGAMVAPACWMRIPTDTILVSQVPPR